MAVYEPRLDWLEEQLQSLNNQTYPNLKLYIRDDASETVDYRTIRNCVERCIRAFPYELRKNERNLGSNGTFELLTADADGKYFAYCDQDDIWLPEKIMRLHEAIRRENSMMAYSDMYVMDEVGNEIASSLKSVRKRLNYVKGDCLAETYFFRNCTAGCVMLVKKEIAQQACPFPKQTVCDQWIAIIAALNGRISFVDMPLIRYRQHGRNQTGVLHGVVDKKTYYQIRIAPLEERLKALEKYAQPSDKLVQFVRGRITGKIKWIWNGRKFSRYDALFEVCARYMPDVLVRLVLRRIS